MAAKGFSVTSPALARRGARMLKTPIEVVVRDAAVHAAHLLVDPLRRAARAGGASNGLVGAITVHDGHLNDLVMRDHGRKGDVIVGVEGRSRYADEAEELEWGGIDTPPVGWVRTTVASRTRDVRVAWSNELTRGLDRHVGS